MQTIVKHSANGIDVLLVAVPKGSTDHNIVHGCRLDYMHEGGMNYTVVPLDLNCEFMFLASSAVEEQCKDVVEWVNGYKDYERIGVVKGFAKSSLRTLIRSHFPDHSGDVAVLRIL